MLDCLFDIDQIEQAHEGQGIHCAIQKAGVSFSPLVPAEGACLGVLEICNDWNS
jgi:hypothetical protein